MSSANRQPREPSRDRRRRETREALLDAAYTAFCTAGYAGSSLEQIAGDAGFTKGALYANFASKEELFLALIERQNSSLFEQWPNSDVTANGTPQSLIHSLGQWLSASMQDNREWFLVNTEFMILAARRSELAARRLVTIEKSCSTLAALIDGAGTSRQAEDSTATARVALALMDGLVLRAAVDPALDLASDFTLGIEALLILEARIMPSSGGATLQ